MRVLATSLVLISGALILSTAIEGYLMVKQRGVWSRLVLVEPVKGPGPAG
jgi:hypothetical protein